MLPGTKYFCFQIDDFKCETSCPKKYLKLEIPGQSKKCVKLCPAGYQPNSLFGPEPKCVKCKAVKCPRGMQNLDQSFHKYVKCPNYSGGLLVRNFERSSEKKLWFQNLVYP